MVVIVRDGGYECGSGGVVGEVEDVDCATVALVVDYEEASGASLLAEEVDS